MSDIIKFKKEVLARLNQSIEYHPRKDHFSNPAANRDAYITKLKNRIESLSRNIMHSPVNRVPQTSSHSLKTSSRNSISEIRPTQIERRVNPFFKRSASPNPKTDSKAGNLGDEIKKISTSKCPNCSRDFEKARLEKHQEICSKSKKKRPTFDAKKQRMREIPPVPKTKSAKPKRPTAEQKSSWRDRHSILISNRGVSGNFKTRQKCPSPCRQWR